jgi:MAF protein
LCWHRVHQGELHCFPALDLNLKSRHRGSPKNLMLLLHYASSRSGMPFAQTRPDAIVIAADTLVALGNEIIGKPSDLEEAGQILRRLSAQTHEVCSAVLIHHQTSGRSSLFHDISRVRFHRLNRAMIKRYLAKVNPLDKAGAYAAQGTGAEIIAKIEGSFTNVVGLPMEKTIATLAKFGIRPKKANKERRLPNRRV